MRTSKPAVLRALHHRAGSLQHMARAPSRPSNHGDCRPLNHLKLVRSVGPRFARVAWGQSWWNSTDERREWPRGGMKRQVGLRCTPT